MKGHVKTKPVCSERFKEATVVRFDSAYPEQHKEIIISKQLTVM